MKKHTLAIEVLETAKDDLYNKLYFIGVKLKADITEDRKKKLLEGKQVTENHILQLSESIIFFKNNY